MIESLLILLSLLIASILPLLVAKRSVLSLYSSPLFFVSLQIFVGAFLKYFVLFSYPSSENLLWAPYQKNLLGSASLYILLFSVLVCAGYLFKGGTISAADVFRVSKEKSLDRVQVTRLFWMSLILTVLAGAFYFGQRSIFSNISGLATEDAFRSMSRSRFDRSDSVDFGVSHAAVLMFLKINIIAFVAIFSNYMWNKQGGIHDNFGNGRIVYIYIAILALFVIMESLVTGRRTLLVDFLIYIMIIMSLSGVKISLKTLFSVLISTGFILVVASMITFYRVGDGEQFSFSSLLDGLLDHVIFNEYFLSITKITVILDRAGDVGFLYGGSFFDWVLGMVPRAIWPDKPAVSLGIFMKREVYQMWGGLGGVPPTFPGEVFLNFGWFGMPIFFVYGFLLKKLELVSFSVRNMTRYNSHMLYVILAPMLSYVLIQTSFSPLMLNLIFLLVLWLIVNRLLFGVRRNR